MPSATISSIFQRLAQKAGLKVLREPGYGYAGQLGLKNGAKKYFCGSHFDLNPLGAAEIAKDKDYAAFFLKQMGYPVIEGEAFCSPEWAKAIQSKRVPEAAYRYAQKLGWPVYVKPNCLRQGIGVAKVYNQREFWQAVKAVIKKDRMFLVQRPAFGRDYRALILDKEAVSVYERLPLSVVGDGQSTIDYLLKKKLVRGKRLGRRVIIEPADFRITNCLKHQGLSRRSVLSAGKEACLLDAANLSSGGEAIDVTDQIHPSFKKLCVKITREMGLRFCGVDLMVEGDIRDPVGQYRVIEINAAPGLYNYAVSGRCQKQRVERICQQIFQRLAKSRDYQV